MLLACEHVLDMGTDLGSSGVGLGDPFGQWPPGLALLMNVAGEHAAREERLVLLGAIGGVRPDARTRVRLADEDGQPCPIMGVGGTGIPGADQAVGLVNADMILVPEYRDG